MPSIDKIPEGKGILVKVLKVGVDATDREINDALYGNPPPGDDFLVLGHESFGIVKAVGSNVRNIKVGDLFHGGSGWICHAIPQLFVVLTK